MEQAPILRHTDSHCESRKRKCPANPFSGRSSHMDNRPATAQSGQTASGSITHGSCIELVCLVTTLTNDQSRHDFPHGQRCISGFQDRNTRPRHLAMPKMSEAAARGGGIFANRYSSGAKLVLDLFDHSLVASDRFQQAPAASNQSRSEIFLHPDILC